MLGKYEKEKCRWSRDREYKKNPGKGGERKLEKVERGN
jgi:hypothetical protein